MRKVRAEALRHVEAGASPAMIARELGVSRQLMALWLRVARKEAKQ